MCCMWNDSTTTTRPLRTQTTQSRVKHSSRQVGEDMNWEDKIGGMLFDYEEDTISQEEIIDAIKSLLKKQAENIADKCGLDCDCGNVGFYVVADNQTGEPVQEQCEYCYTTPYSKFSILSLTEPE